jgi:hypothetical protein
VRLFATYRFGCAVEGWPRADQRSGTATRPDQRLAVLIKVDDRHEARRFGGSIHLAIAAEQGVESRRSRIYGGRAWVRLGAVELGLDYLRATCRASPSPNAPISSGCDRFHAFVRQRSPSLELSICSSAIAAARTVLPTVRQRSRPARGCSKSSRRSPRLRTLSIAAILSIASQRANKAK